MLPSPGIFLSPTSVACTAHTYMLENSSILHKCIYIYASEKALWTVSQPGIQYYAAAACGVSVFGMDVGIWACDINNVSSNHFSIYIRDGSILPPTGLRACLETKTLNKRKLKTHYLGLSLKYFRIHHFKMFTMRKSENVKNQASSWGLYLGLPGGHFRFCCFCLFRA